LLAWVQALGSLRAWPGKDLEAAAADARRRGSRAVQDVVALGAAIAGRPGRTDIATLAARVSADHGLVVAGRVLRGAVDSGEPQGHADGASPEKATGRLTIVCFGGFEVRDGDDEVDLSGLRPRARSVLRMLAVRTGGVHRDVLVERLWPADDEASGTRKLHVAISAIRRALDPDGSVDVVRRRGELYQLADGVDCDVAMFDAAINDGRAAHARRDGVASRAAWRRALDLHRGELLPDEGSAEWAVAARQVADREVTAAATQLAEQLIGSGDAAEAVAVCEAGLRIDQYSDPLWRIKLRALLAHEDHAGHVVAAAQYEAVLAELGVVGRGTTP
jgi:DNA-binding SARP family transcriptional activator